MDTEPKAAKFEMSKPGKTAWTGKYEGDVGTGIYVMNANGNGLTAIQGDLDTATVLGWQPVAG